MDKTDKTHNDSNLTNSINGNIAQENTDQSDKILHNHHDFKLSSIQILSSRLRELRKAHHLTQKSLGKQIGVSKQAVSNWENAKTYVPIRKNNLEKLASSLMCTEDYLCGITDKKNAYQEDGKTVNVFGISAPFISEIRSRLPSYSYEQREFLYEFLFLFETLSPAQLELLNRFTVAIASSNIPSITLWHPLFNFDSFNKIFSRTKHQIDEIEQAIHKEAIDSKKTIPFEIENAILNLHQAIEKDFNILSYPLQSKQKFKNQLKYINQSFKNFHTALAKIYDKKTHSKQLSFYREMYLSELNKALDSDIESLFHLLKTN